MDWSEKNACIKCDKGGNLLVCGKNGCPLAIHEECLGCPAKFDDSGRFYCPFCLYKQAVAESRKARDYALARKKDLLIFMDEKVIGSEKHIRENKTCEDNGHNQSKTSDAIVNIASSDDGKSKSNNNGIIDQPLQLDEEENVSSAEEDSQASDGSKRQDPSLEMQGEKSNRTEEEKQVQEEEHETSAEEEQIQEEERKTSVEEEHNQEEERETSVEEEKIQEEERETSVEEEKIQEEEREASSVSTDQDPSLTVHARAKRRSKRSKPVDQDSDAEPVQSKLLKQDGKKKQTSPTVTSTRRFTRKSSSMMRTGKVLNEQVGSPSRSRKPKEPSVKLGSDMFGCAKRKRLLWTEKEEEALRAGVERYSKEPNGRKLPWKKILDIGRASHQFDESRTPADLKDKWRNMLAK